MKINLFNKKSSLRRFEIFLLILGILIFGSVGISYTEVVGLWRFDEGTGEMAHDSSGNKNDGLIHGTQWVEGSFGTGLSFNGIDSYVDLFSPAGLMDITEAVTIAVWVKPSSIDGYRYIFDTLGNYGCRMLIADENWQFWVANEVDGERKTAGLNIASAIAEKWCYVVGIYTGKELRGHVNGKVPNWLLHHGGIGASKGKAVIGAYTGCSTGFFKGIIGELTIYDHVLTPEEVKTNFEKDADKYQVEKEPLKEETPF